MKIPVPDTNQPAMSGHRTLVPEVPRMGGLTLKFQAASVPEALQKSKHLLNK
jgi:D-aminopeptidase